MSTNTFKNELVAEFVNELGTLLSIRISQYISKHKNGSETNFLNEFLIFPHLEDFDNDYIRHPAMARNHFEENLNAGFDYLVLIDIRLDSNKNLEYYFAWYAEYFEPEYVSFGLNGKLVLIDEQETIDFLESQKDDFWEKMIKDVQKEISFGTLKNL